MVMTQSSLVDELRSDVSEESAFPISYKHVSKYIRFDLSQKTTVLKVEVLCNIDLLLSS